jgi:hypothetical protein
MIDDKIVYALNNSIPTVSFKGQINAAEKCQELHKQVIIIGQGGSFDLTWTSPKML